MTTSSRPPGVAFVVGGGGHLGAHEVGMLKALIEHDIRPDLILGTSVGAINGALLASDPSAHAVTQLVDMWKALESSGIMAGSAFQQLTTLARTRTHAHTADPLRHLLEERLPVRLIEELAVPFQCVAASIERSAEHWFTSGSIADAVLASSALPGVLPPVEIDGEHFIDGGVVNSIPVGRAVQLGAGTIYVLHVGRVDSVLRPPRWPWEVAMVAFEIARRHRYVSDMSAVPAGVVVHVLPTGVVDPPRFNDWSQLRYRDFSRVSARIELSYQATHRYLDTAGATGPR